MASLINQQFFTSPTSAELMTFLDDEEDYWEEVLAVMIKEGQIQFRNTLYKQPCRTRPFTGHQVIMDILRGHPDRGYQIFRMTTFIILRDELVAKGLLKGSRHLTADEQLGIFLFVVGHGVTNRVLAETFQHSGETIDPADGTALVVVAILFLAFERRLIFTRVGDCKWHYFGNEDHYYYYYDVMFDPRGMRLLATAYGDQPHLQLVEIHVGSEEITTFVLDSHSINILGHLAAYDVDDDGGGGGGSGLLYVSSHHHSFHSRRTTHIKIYEAEMDHQERRSKMTLASLGGRALFVGAGSSVSVSAADVRRLKLKANQVYFSKNMCFLLNLFFCSCGDDSGIYNLEDQDISFLIKRYERSIDTIDGPRSWLPPIWVSPSLRRRPTA